MPNGDYLDGNFYPSGMWDEHGELNSTVNGSKRILGRDLSEQQSWWTLRPKRESQIKPIPAGKKWCSRHPLQTPHDALLETDPDQYWDMLGWVDKHQFKNDTERADGKYPVCNACLARQKRLLVRSRKDAPLLKRSTDHLTS